MALGALMQEIANNFSSARKERYKEHPLAGKIRGEWPAEIERLLGPEYTGSVQVDSSAGQGVWANAPWAAMLDPRVTHSAKHGFYPVYLFEPGFRTVCLVLGQGVATLEGAIGKKGSRHELGRRADLLRKRGGEWASKGFTAGPFHTFKSLELPRGGGGAEDSWSVSVAFGKRYQVDEIPADEALAADLKAMLDLYKPMAIDPELSFSKTDTDLLSLKNEGELPRDYLEGKRVLKHKKFEQRNRNQSLVKEVKKRLGRTCQACEVKLGELYGPGMSDYIEAHHVVPVDDLPAEGKQLKPTAENFIVLCSNCHRAIHRAGCPTLFKFRETLKEVLWPWQADLSKR